MKRQYLQHVSNKLLKLEDLIVSLLLTSTIKQKKYAMKLINDLKFEIERFENHYKPEVATELAVSELDKSTVILIMLGMTVQEYTSISNERAAWMLENLNESGVLTSEQLIRYNESIHLFQCVNLRLPDDFIELKKSMKKLKSIDFHAENRKLNNLMKKLKQLCNE